MQTSNTNNNLDKAERTTTVVVSIVVTALVILLIAVTAVFLLNNTATSGQKPDEMVEAYFQSLPVVTSDGNRLYIDSEPTSEDGQLLYSYIKDVLTFDVVDVQSDKKSAIISVNINCPDMSVMPELISKKMKSEIETRLNTSDKSEIYNNDDTIRDDTFEEIYRKALAQSSVDAPLITMNAKMYLSKHLGGWQIDNEAEITNTLDERAQKLKADTKNSLDYVSKKYPIPETAKSAPSLDESAFIETSDPSVVDGILNDKYARNLINGQKLVWDSSLEFLPGSTITCYLDESILMIEWQQKEAGIVGTFCETFVSDGSQIRRKIAGDSFGDMNFQTCTDFAKEVKAVAAVGGDFYNHGRNCGIVVYDRNVYRLDYSTCDVCYITSGGDMLFSYRNQFSNENQIKEFLSENDILWSLSFGPVLIDDGKDMTPQSYAWGEINDTYARAALGMLGDKHYLTMNLNCGDGDTYGYASLRQAADVMISKGCIKAYTLDGGQTATTVVNGILKNPVQFGWEKQISDIIYFASGIPE